MLKTPQKPEKSQMIDLFLDHTCMLKINYRHKCTYAAQRVTIGTSDLIEQDRKTSNSFFKTISQADITSVFKKLTNWNTDFKFSVQCYLILVITGINK